MLILDPNPLQKYLVSLLGSGIKPCYYVPQRSLKSQLELCQTGHPLLQSLFTTIFFPWTRPRQIIMTLMESIYFCSNSYQFSYVLNQQYLRILIAHAPFWIICNGPRQLSCWIANNDHVFGLRTSICNWDRRIRQWTADNLGCNPSIGSLSIVYSIPANASPGIITRITIHCLIHFHGRATEDWIRK